MATPDLSTLGTKIEAILQKRKMRAGPLEQLKRHLSSIRDQWEELSITAANSAEKVAGNSPIKNLSSQMATSQITPKLADLETRLTRLIERCKKDTITIGVLGQARMGKSTLLQSLTGLSKEAIPSSDTGFCTGASSRIVHFEGEPYGYIEFYSREEFVREVLLPFKEELKSVLPDPSILDSLHKFKNAGLPDPEKATNFSHRHLLERLTCIQRDLPKFETYLGMPGKKVSLAEFPNYVAQNQSNPFWRATKLATCYATFPAGVSKLALVDLPGLGEMAPGLEKNLLRALAFDVDLIFLVRKLDEFGDDFKDADKNVFSLIESSIPELSPQDWAFFILNIPSGFKNQQLMRYFQENAYAKGVRASKILTANCHDPADVQQSLMIPTLDILEQNLEGIDRKVLGGIQSLAREIHSGIQEQLASFKLDKDVSEALDQKDFQRFKIRFEKFEEELTFGLEVILEKTRPKPMQKTAEANFGSKFSVFVQRMKEEITRVQKLAEERIPLPPKEDIEKRVKLGKGMVAVVTSLLHDLRVGLAKNLDELDDFLTKFLEENRKEIRDLLNRDDLLGPLFKVNGIPNESILQWLQEQFQKEDCPLLAQAFKKINSLSISYRTFFHYLVRPEMKTLDTYFAGEPDGAPQVTGQESSDSAISKLQMAYKQALFQSTESMQKNCETPFFALFSALEEFGDLILRDRNARKELNDFVFKYRQVLWSQDYQLVAEEAKARHLIARGIESLREQAGKLVAMTDAVAGGKN